MKTAGKQRSRARSEEDKHKLYQEILDTSVRLYSEAGYDGFSMRKLAAMVNGTTTMIYHYFDDKNSILEAVFNQQLDLFIQAIQSDKENIFERLLDIGEKYIRYGYQHPEEYKLMFVYRPAFLLKQDAASRKERRSLLSALQQALPASFLAGSSMNTALTDAMWAQVHGLVTLSITQDDFNEERALVSLNTMMALLQAQLSSATPR